MPHRTVPELRVYIAGVPVSGARLIRVRHACDNVLDTCVFEVEPEHRDNAWMEDFGLAEAAVEYNGALCNVVVQDKDGIWKQIHHGRVASTEIVVGEDSEVIRYHSRFDRFMWQDEPFPGQGDIAEITQNAESAEVPESVRFFRSEFAHYQYIFNPIIDGKPFQNLIIDEFDDYNYVHPDSHRMEDMTGDPFLVEYNATFWNAASIVEWLCNALNVHAHVQMPLREDLERWLEKIDIFSVRHFTPQFGAWFPDIVGDLLRPFGYSMHLQYAIAPQDGSNPPDLPSFRIAERGGSSPAQQLRLQRYGENLKIKGDDVSDLDFTEVKNINLTVDTVNNAATNPVVLGDYRTYEATFELVPAWDPQHDDIPWKELRTNSPEMQQDPVKSRVYRDWVLNEGGDYAKWAEHPKRAGTIYEGGLANAYTFSEITQYETQKQDPVSVVISKIRRKFLPMLTTTDDQNKPTGPYRGIDVEYHDGEGDPTDDSTWKDVNQLKLNPRILNTECGIRFQSLGHAGRYQRALGMGTFRVRVTACVAIDTRLYVVNPLRDDPQYPDTTLLPQRKTMVVDRAKAYAYKVILPESKYSALQQFANRQVDNTQEATVLQDNLQTLYNQATISGSVTLEGIDFGLEYIGRSIIDAQLRNIDFRTTAPNWPVRYPTVLAVDYDVQNQTTRLTIQTYRPR